PFDKASFKMSADPNGIQVDPVSEENKVKAEEAKEAANKLFNGGLICVAAIAKYTEAINLNPNVAQYYANRSFAHIKTEAYGFAVEDAERAVKVDPTYVKVAKKNPSDTDVGKKLAECKKIVKQIEFEKAIEVDSHQKNIAETMDVDAIVVDPSYSGPKLADGQITKEFIAEMMESSHPCNVRINERFDTDNFSRTEDDVANAIVGNHETDDMNKVYGFEGEVKAKYSEQMFELFSETFTTLPLAHLINKKILVVHGGLFSRDDVTLDEIRKIDRIGKKQPDHGNPQLLPGRGPSKRGVGIQFGPDITESFLKRNNIDLLIRSHEVKENGYVVEHNGKCALINITPDLQLSYQTFEAV
ncbi:5599_t:CDS:10, partial [Racocetra fulgida]